MNILKVLLSITVFVTSVYSSNSNEFIHPFSVSALSPVFESASLEVEFDLCSEVGFSGAVCGEVLPFHIYKKMKESGENPFAKMDEFVELLDDSSIELILTLAPTKIDDKGNVFEILPRGQEMDSYLEYVEDVVYRYTDSVAVWQVGSSLSNDVWRDTPENYAELVAKTVERIRESFVPAKVAIADTQISKTDEFIKAFLTKFLRALPEGTWFEYMMADAVGELCHPDENKHLELLLWDDNIKTLLGGFGFENVSFMAKINTYGGAPADSDSDLAPVSEREQAFYLVKQYITAAALGYKQVFYMGGVVEKPPVDVGESLTSKMFDSLVFNPQVNSGLSHKKLAFYSTKKIIEMLSGFDSDACKVISTEQLFLVCFSKEEGMVYVAWRECCSYDYAITALSGKRAKVTYALPRFNSGDKVTDLGVAFESFEKKISRGILSLRLTDSPVFIEVFKE